MNEKTTAIVLNWNELDISRDSVRLLLKEPTVAKVILVDNGSKDGSREYFIKIDDPKFFPIFLPENKGSSIARNVAISNADTEYVFLLDGDILYVKGTIKEYEKILNMYRYVGCVGQNSMQLLNELGHNGVYDPSLADFRMTNDYVIEEWFPMAWTQYGLFRTEMLKELKFVELPPFNEAGYGFEDDWLFHDMDKNNYTSLSVNKPIYYHHAHSGMRELEKAGLADKMIKRKQVFEDTWGPKSGWSDTVKKRSLNKKVLSNPV